MANYGFTGTTSVNSVITPNIKIRLFDHETGQFLSEQLSDSLGVYTFSGLNETKTYDIIAYGTHPYCSKVRTNQTPEIL